MEKGKFPALVEAFKKHSKVPPNYWTCPKCGEVWWLGSWGVEQDGSTNPILVHLRMGAFSSKCPKRFVSVIGHPNQYFMSIKFPKPPRASQGNFFLGPTHHM